MTLSTSHHDLNSKDMQYLKDFAYLESLERSPEEEVQHYLDCIQSSNEEKQSLHELTLETLHTDGKEWINEEMNIGSSEDFDNYEYWCQLLDEAEMNMDMNTFEDEGMCHQLFADNPGRKGNSVHPLWHLRRNHISSHGRRLHISVNHTRLASLIMVRSSFLMVSHRTMVWK